MKIIKFISIFLIIVTLVGCSTTNTENIENTENTENTENIELTLVLDWTPNTNHTGFVVALEKGYYEEEGLSLNIVQPYEDGTLTLVALGTAEFGISFPEQVANAISNQNLPVTSIATILQDTVCGIISLKEENIESFKDLEFKTYATWGLDFEQAVLRQAMEDEGADFSNVDLYYSTVTDTFSALEGDVDAVWVYEGWDVMLAEIMGLDFNFVKFNNSDSILDYYTPILVANNDFIENNKETVVKFLRATKKGYEFAMQNPEEAAEILVEYYPEIDFSLALESQKYLADKYVIEGNSWGETDPERWNNFFNWAYEEGILSQSLENIGFTNEFLLELENEDI